MNVDWIQLGLVRARANGRIGGGRYKLSTMQQAEGNQDDSAWREEFAHGDIQGALAVFTDDILWHVPGRGPLSRDYRGRDEVLGFLQHFMELSRGTFRIRLTTFWLRVTELSYYAPKVRSAEIEAGHHRRSTFKNGRTSVFCQYQGDQQTEDEFWSAPV